MATAGEFNPKMVGNTQQNPPEDQNALSLGARWTSPFPGVSQQLEAALLTFASRAALGSPSPAPLSQDSHATSALQCFRSQMCILREGATMYKWLLQNSLKPSLLQCTKPRWWRHLGLGRSSLECSLCHILTSRQCDTHRQESLCMKGLRSKSTLKHRAEPDVALPQPLK